ncbi:unnamed protein product [Penicillium roqueforti FM164]|uniref:Genomic scaffold, ProqFM164S01 n=1 Tax=Penicillium roqueforti (strain FM164) TaxID=1365484 RepID=W6PZF7_PENRF|nr:unnamed protein product [Penicillium roqueforti FM164]
MAITGDPDVIRREPCTVLTAFVVYGDVHGVKQACDKLNGFNFQNKYLVSTCQTQDAYRGIVYMRSNQTEVVHEE